MELDMCGKVLFFSFGLLVGAFVSSDAQDTSQMKCGSGDHDEKDCLKEYMDERFETLALRYELFINKAINEKLAEQNSYPNEQRPSNCHDIWTQGNFESGVYSIFVPNCVETSSGQVCQSDKTHIRVYCDLDNDFGGPGWTVFQRRQDGSVNFTRNWNTYKHGFGDLDGELWLGNDNIAKITASGRFRLRIDLGDWEGEYRYAEYSFIRVLGEEDKYQLFYGDYSGDAGDALDLDVNFFHNGTYFSTIDQDNDHNSAVHCALQWWNSGFWSSNCGNALLNSPYHAGGVAELGKGIMWYTWHGEYYSMKSTVMKIRPVFD